MFLKLLDRHIHHGTLTVVEPNGQRHTFGEGTPAATWVLNARGTARRILLNPQANLGETYMNGEWDVEDGDLADLLTVLRVNLERRLSDRSLTALLGPLATLVTSWNNLRASLSNVSHHYNLDEALFRAFLDRDMHYSCAYFRTPDRSPGGGPASQMRPHPAQASPRARPTRARHWLRAGAAWPCTSRSVPAWRSWG